MNKVTLAIVPLLLLTACGSENEQPLEKTSPAQSNPPTAKSPGQNCGSDFYTERSLNKFEFSSVFWQVEGSRLQSKPEFRFYADNRSLSATHTISSDKTLCLLAASVFGSISAEVWDGEDNASFKKGELYYYAPEFKFQTNLPDIASLKDWRSKGKPERITQPLENVNLTIHHRNKDNNLITFGDLQTNLNPVALNCDQTEFDITLSLKKVSDIALATLQPSYCETQIIGKNTETYCLSAGFSQDIRLESCKFDSTKVALPDQRGNKTSVEVSGLVKFSEMSADLQITGINL
ncbi:hypothetical protein [Pseudoalteromonas luteoviolacea]|uniref:Lipoprotein n=1 Tax=Pseudoalteromonas luteoviolacea H33 TaxID=1365251 RepID=A0A167CXB3_9GAMM|nr:hypothetical protein [Pseudoalteromonas luteoviolacea]KZN48174.1 hypothetical protein N476_22230 [Pseudoalteromonas luteoviolacea H33]KZN78188.1 hypothetical protein N477_10005 [Pseudoalteromonas luteoviolacea H33-S]MBQ4876661.1 hypothetical protein [Pseudoalteromonas luteoviolacea]MBQ4905550.1 hypothetical protein [Pseudoalteromonas luteoviolacea]